MLARSIPLIRPMNSLYRPVPIHKNYLLQTKALTQLVGKKAPCHLRLVQDQPHDEHRIISYALPFKVFVGDARALSCLRAFRRNIETPGTGRRRLVDTALEWLLPPTLVPASLCSSISKPVFCRCTRTSLPMLRRFIGELVAPRAPPLD